jgi:hypothetical protein
VTDVTSANAGVHVGFPHSGTHHPKRGDRCRRQVLGVSASTRQHEMTGWPRDSFRLPPAARAEVKKRGRKILDALRSNGYEPALRIEDVEIHGAE